jgi:predicted nucleic acid-binding protein
MEYGQALPGWVKIVTVNDTRLQDALQIEVDAGEASVIALATELIRSIMILDDLEARQLARQLKLTFNGTLGLIVRAKRTGHIESVKPLIEKMQRTNFRITDKLYLDVLTQANENT